MKLKKISINNLKIPFSRKVEHRLHARQQTESIVLTVLDSDGMAGFGEGTPRRYVTGEHLEQSLIAAHALSEQVLGREIDSRDALFTLLTSIGKSDVACTHPAAFCALETALLDLWTRQKGQPLYRFFNVDSKTDRLNYSGVIPFIRREDQFSQTLQLVQQLNLPALKLKVINIESGIAQLKQIRSVLGPDIDLRVDANCAFTSRAALTFIEQATPMAISAVEQPVAKDDLQGLKIVSAASRIPIIADESMYTTHGPQYLIENHICDGINIRLSSCGGFIKAYDLYRQAVSNKIMVVLGSHVGETAILSFAGRHLAMLCPEAIHLEGSFSKYVLKADLVKDDVSFGMNGKAPRLSGTGLGVAIEPALIAKWSAPFAVLHS